MNMKPKINLAEVLARRVCGGRQRSMGSRGAPSTALRKRRQKVCDRLAGTGDCEKMYCWSNRFKGAVLIVFFVLAAPWCIAQPVQFQQKLEMAEQSDSSSLDILNREFIDLNRYSSVRFHEETGVCGFESEASARQTYEDILMELEEKSWVGVPSDETSASFYKTQGTYRWAYVSCATVQGTTVVVCNLA